MDFTSKSQGFLLVSFDRGRPLWDLWDVGFVVAREYVWQEWMSIPRVGD